jgi:hypothetical protein
MATSAAATEVRGPTMVERQRLSRRSVEGGDGVSSAKWERRKEGGEKNRGKERCRWGEKILEGKNISRQAGAAAWRPGTANGVRK